MNNLQEKFCVVVGDPITGVWFDYFSKFYKHCKKIAYDSGWNHETVVNHNLKPHGRLVKTNTQGWYLRWDDEKYHTLFVLKWS